MKRVFLVSSVAFILKRGDINGRTLGRNVGQEVWSETQAFIQGGEPDYSV